MSTLVGFERDGTVCVAVFMPPDASAQLDVWREGVRDEFGPPDEWIINRGRADGGDFISVWVPEGHLPSSFPVGKRLR
jgi:hypothetical protein